MHHSMKLQQQASSLQRTNRGHHALQRQRLVQAAAALRPAQQQQQQEQQHLNQQAASNAAALTAVAALVLQAFLPVPQAAAAALPGPAGSSFGSVHAEQQQQRQQQPLVALSAWQPVLGDVAAAAAPPAEDAGADMTLQEIETDIMGEVALPPELREFMELTQKGPVKSAKRLSAARRAVGFDRTLDGRVLLFSEDEEPFQVKPDMGVPGALLLRDAGGFMYYIPPADNESLAQIDLSDDAIVAQLFANHAWEELVEPLEVLTEADQQQAAAAAPPLRSKQQLNEPAGHLEQLRLTERQFRGVISLLAGSQELPEEPLEDLDALEAPGGR